MKVIKRGKLPKIKPRLFGGTCKKCGCQVEVPECEAVPETNTTGEAFGCLPQVVGYYVPCCPTPNCGVGIALREILFR